MRELFEINPPESPITAAQRGARPALRRRFYERATVVPEGSGHALRLDDKPVHTPARRLLAAPTRALAEAMAVEWQAQQDVIDPATMPLTRLANVIIDGVADAPQPVADEIAKYLASDLLFYRAATPAGLVALQARHWDPILAWARQTLGADFRLGEGVVHVAQPPAALVAARAAIPAEPWRLGASHAATTLTGSALIALAMAQGTLGTDAAWQAAHVDEDWNIAQWGSDELALQRRAFRLAEFQAAAAVLANLQSMPAEQSSEQV
jgi:chaperone required for assembly of F1-ATPase